MLATVTYDREGFYKIRLFRDDHELVAESRSTPADEARYLMFEGEMYTMFNNRVYKLTIVEELK